MSNNLNTDNHYLLRLSEQFANLLQNASIQVWILKDEETYAWANEAHANFLGIDVNRIPNKKITEILDTNESAMILRTNRIALKSKDKISTEEWLTDYNGEAKLLDITKKTMFNCDGKFDYIVCYGIDITNRHNAETQFILDHKYIYSLVDEQIELICRYLPDGTIVFANKAFCDHYGKPFEDIRNLNKYDLIEENIRDKTWEEVKQLKCNNYRVSGNKMLDANGRELWIHWVDKAICNAGGEITEYQSVGRDVTTIKESENDLMNFQLELEDTIKQNNYNLEQANAALLLEVSKSKKYEESLKKRNSIEKAIGNISKKFINFTSLDFQVDDSLKEIGLVCQADRAYIFQFREDNKSMDNTHEWVADGVKSEKENLQNLPTEIFPWWINIIRNNEYIHIKNIEELPEEAENERRILKEQNIVSVLVFPLIINGEVAGFVGVDNVNYGGQWNQNDYTLLKVASEILGNAFEREEAQNKIIQTNHKLNKLLSNTVDVISSTLEMVDPYTAGHQKNVAHIACKIATKLGLPQVQVEGLKVAALLHDIGKIYIPTSILSKPSKLRENEFNLIKEHPQIGYNIIKGVDFPWQVADIILQHHERIDGSGYPNGLKGEEILIESKIIAVADVIDAMSSHRPYRPALGIEKAMEEIRANCGVLYDFNVVGVVVDSINDITLGGV